MRPAQIPPIPTGAATSSQWMRNRAPSWAGATSQKVTTSCMTTIRAATFRSVSARAWRRGRAG
jgi:hypothetical protein